METEKPEIPEVAALQQSPSSSSPLSPPQPSPAPRKHQNVAEVLGFWLCNLVIAIVFAAFFVVFLYQPVKVEGASMMPGIDDQERICVNKFVYRFEPISRGDVIVFRYPLDPSKSFIKRVIGVAGDRVRIERGLVYLNGEPITEDYVPPQYADWSSHLEITVPNGYYFMMGDNRNRSKDSREFGPVAERYVVGKAVFGYWPMEKLGTVK